MKILAKSKWRATAQDQSSASLKVLCLLKNQGQVGQKLFRATPDLVFQQKIVYIVEKNAIYLLDIIYDLLLLLTKCQ